MSWCWNWSCVSKQPHSEIDAYIQPQAAPRVSNVSLINRPLATARRTRRTRLRTILVVSPWPPVGGGEIWAQNVQLLSRKLLQKEYITAPLECWKGVIHDFFRKNFQTVRYGLGLQIIPAIGVKNFWADTVGLDMSPTMKTIKCFLFQNFNLVGYNYIDMKQGQQFCDVDKELYWYVKKGVLSSEVNDLIWVYVQMPFGLLAFVMIWKVIVFTIFLWKLIWMNLMNFHQISINLQSAFPPKKKGSTKKEIDSTPFSRFDKFA